MTILTSKPSCSCFIAACLQVLVIQSYCWSAARLPSSVYRRTRASYHATEDAHHKEQHSQMLRRRSEWTHRPAPASSAATSSSIRAVDAGTVMTRSTESIQELIARVTSVAERQVMAAVQQLEEGKQYPDATTSSGRWGSTVAGEAPECRLHLVLLSHQLAVQSLAWQQWVDHVCS